MNKAEFMKEIQNKTGFSKENAEAFLNAFVSTVSEELKKGEKIQLIGFGTFLVKERAARMGRNPQTGEQIEICSRNVSCFTAGKKLKEEINR